MKLITTAYELEKEFRRLIKQYKEFYWATAWASASSKVFKELITNKRKIKRIAVGIHFYQTHPDFIEAFLDNNSVRFIEQPQGTFHPKLYLFRSNTKEWEIIVGSANFTKEAFSRNTETNVLLSNIDNDCENAYNDAIELIEKCWKQGKVFDENDLEKYRITWEIQRPKLNSLSGLYGSENRTPKPVHEVPMMSRSWDEFMKEIRKEVSHGLDNRIKVIEIARSLFENKPHFNAMSENERKFIAGIPNKLSIPGAEYWGYFGSMKGAGIFKNKIIDNDDNISIALDQIPHAGQITKKNYYNFIKIFKKTFSGNYIATATRLLCMKRPDTFVCFDSKNRSALCKDFGIVQSEMDYDRYWNDIIERIYDSAWWQNPDPKNEIENKVSNARAAFLDSIYYEE